MPGIATKGTKTQNQKIRFVLFVMNPQYSTGCTGYGWTFFNDSRRAGSSVIF
jgi:hypothetical protein